LDRLKDEEAEWIKLRDKIKSRLELVVGESKEFKREVRLSLSLLGDHVRRLMSDGGSK
jgi:hypothetical protein